MAKRTIPEGSVVKLVTDTGDSDIDKIHAVKAFGPTGMEFARGMWTVYPGTLCGKTKARNVSMVDFYTSMRMPHGEQEICEDCLNRIVDGKGIS